MAFNLHILLNQMAKVVYVVSPAYSYTHLINFK